MYVQIGDDKGSELKKKCFLHVCHWLDRQPDEGTSITALLHEKKDAKSTYTAKHLLGKNKGHHELSCVLNALRIKAHPIMFFFVYRRA